MLLQSQPFGITMHSRVPRVIRSGGTNLVLLHVSAAGCLPLGSGCCGFCQRPASATPRQHDWHASQREMHGRQSTFNCAYQAEHWYHQACVTTSRLRHAMQALVDSLMAVLPMMGGASRLGLVRAAAPLLRALSQSSGSE